MLLTAFVVTGWTQGGRQKVENATLKMNGKRKADLPLAPECRWLTPLERSANLLLATMSIRPRPPLQCSSSATQLWMIASVLTRSPDTHVRPLPETFGSLRNPFKAPKGTPQHPLATMPSWAHLHRHWREDKVISNHAFPFELIFFPQLQRNVVSPAYQNSPDVSPPRDTNEIYTLW